MFSDGDGSGNGSGNFIQHRVRSIRSLTKTLMETLKGKFSCSNSALWNFYFVIIEIENKEAVL